MATKRASVIPKSLFVYICDYDGDDPVFAAVSNIREIPDDENGSAVALFEKASEHTFEVTRRLA